MKFPHGEQVTILRPGGTDRYGDELPDEEIPLPELCAISPRSSVEVQNYSDTTLTGLMMLAPYGSDIRPTDRIRRADGTVWSVVGEVGQWKSSLTGWEACCQVALERGEG